MVKICACQAVQVYLAFVELEAEWVATADGAVELGSVGQLAPAKATTTMFVRSVEIHLLVSSPIALTYSARGSCRPAWPCELLRTPRA